MNDNSIMPWGIHKGKAMANVPERYLLTLYEKGGLSGEILEYVKENLDAIRNNLAREAEKAQSKWSHL